MSSQPGCASSSDATPAQTLEHLLAQQRPIVMGILNITPDSFSDGGLFLDPAMAVAQAQRMAAEGADIIDVGAESTRPYGSRIEVPLEQELERLLPVLPTVTGLGLPVSVDTMKAEVARQALALGVTMVNDIWGLQRDPEMAAVVAEHRVPIIITHNREQADPRIDIIGDIKMFFKRSLAIAEHAGVAASRIVLDPGIGFGKTSEQSLAVIARCSELRAFGKPLMIGLSRKRFIASVVPASPPERVAGSIAGNLLAVLAGVSIVRVHDVAATVQALRVAKAIEVAR
jgi:dihydropteroate synthase